MMLHKLLDSVHRAVPPAGSWSYIDDIVGRAEGTNQKALIGLEATADVMASGLAELRLQISSKTKLVASSDEIWTELQRRLRRKGIPVEYVRFYGRSWFRCCSLPCSRLGSNDQTSCSGSKATKESDEGSPCWTLEICHKEVVEHR